MKNFPPSIFLKKRQSGFSLMELLIVMAILIIIAGIGLMVFQQIKLTMRLSGTVRQLITDLRYAQQLAITEQVTHGLQFSTTTPPGLDQYQLIRYGQPSQVIFTKQLPQGIRFQSIGFTNQKVSFNPYGAAQQSGEIVLINTQNASSTIDVRPSGFVKKK
jgi:prepilin-type N-terminal cleavage/methylation domain-containing protein